MSAVEKVWQYIPLLRWLLGSDQAVEYSPPAQGPSHKSINQSIHNPNHSLTQWINHVTQHFNQLLTWIIQPNISLIRTTKHFTPFTPSIILLALSVNSTHVFNHTTHSIPYSTVFTGSHLGLDIGDIFHYLAISYSAIAKNNPRQNPYFSHFYACGGLHFRTTIKTKA